QWTWVWEADIQSSCNRMMDDVDEWKAAKVKGCKLSIAEFVHHKYKRSTGATAGASGRCFLEAFHSSLYLFGLGGLVTVELWNAYAQASKKDFSEGVTTGEQVEFYRFACS
ncbi:hypothetical protein PHYSODRAFT_528736, partial [Phytophthora sojae]